MSLETLLQQALDENNIQLNNEAFNKLIQFLNLLQIWNRVFNLTTITDPREMVYLHIIDSLVVSPYLKGQHILDVGSGAGLPGIPLAIINPQQEWVLLDKNNKKTRFLTQVVAELQLTNVHVIYSRSEDFHHDARFDTILSRAYGTLRLFIETTAHLLYQDGILIAMKGKYPQEELDDIPDRFTASQVIRLNVKGINIERHLVCLRPKTEEV